jgi:hypothetical protein
MDFDLIHSTRKKLTIISPYNKILARRITLKSNFLLVFSATLGLIVASGCDIAKIPVRRVVVEGDSAKFVGERLVSKLRTRGVRISESLEGAPILTATSTVKKMDGGVRVFTLEVTDGAGLKVRKVVSTQDVPTAPGIFIERGVIETADSVVRQLKLRQPAPGTAPEEKLKPERFQTN